jgi:hypothetical protein
MLNFYVNTKCIGEELNNAPVMFGQSIKIQTHFELGLTSTTNRKIVIGCALSKMIYLEPLPDHISTVVHNLNRC